MSLYKRGRVYWLRTDPVTGGRLSTRSTDKAAAKLFEAERQRIAADPRHAAASAARLEEWVKKTMAAKRAVRSSATVGMYETKLGHAVRIFGAGAPLSSIDPDAVDRYIEQRREEGAVDNTIQRELSCLTQLLKLARRKGCYVGAIEALRPVGFSSGYKPRRRVLSPEEWAALEAVLPAQRRAWCAFAIATGARLSEVTRALPGDYDAARGVMLLRGSKTRGSWREVPVGPFRALFELALPFLPLSWSRVSKDLPEYCAELGIPAATPNDLRRTHATWLLRAGADRYDVSKMLGHKTSRLVEEVYGQVEATDLGRRILSRIGGTGTSQQSTRPLGGMADAADLKGSTDSPCSNAFAGFADSGGFEVWRNSTLTRTEASHWPHASPRNGWRHPWCGLDCPFHGAPVCSGRAA